MSIKTFLKLIHESRTARFSSTSRKFRIFKTLFSLYFASKFSENKKEIILHKFDGLVIHAYDYYHLIFLYREIFVAQAYHFRSNTKKPLIIDCGANIGMSVIYFKKLYPNSKIIAFEPNPYAFSLLEKNISVNNLYNVELYKNAVSGITGKSQMTIPRQKGALDASIVKNHSEGEVWETETVQLSKIISQRKVDLLKIDIEGAEEPVIRDLITSGTIQNINNIIFEFHNASNELSIEEFYNKYFKGIGFKLTIQENYVTRETTGDKLLILSR